MVRPKRRVLLASESLVLVSAGEPGGRPQAKAEMPAAGAGRRTSTERCLTAASRSFHGEGNRHQSGPEGLLDLAGVAGRGTFPEKNAEQKTPNRIIIKPCVGEPHGLKGPCSRRAGGDRRYRV